MKKVVMMLALVGLATVTFAQSTAGQGRIIITDEEAAQAFKEAIHREVAHQVAREEIPQLCRRDVCVKVRNMALPQEEANRYLRVAFEQNDLDNMVDLIGQNGADITTVVKNQPLTHEEANKYLLASAVYGQWDSVISLIEDSGADIEITDDGGNTVLMYAAEQRSVPMVRYLLAYKNVSLEYVNAVNKAGESALSLAENEEIIEMLIGSGALMECGD